MAATTNTVDWILFWAPWGPSVGAAEGKGERRWCPSQARSILTMMRNPTLIALLIFGLGACGSKTAAERPGAGGAMTNGGTQGSGGATSSGLAPSMGGSYHGFLASLEALFSVKQPAQIVPWTDLLC